MAKTAQRLKLVDWSKVSLPEFGSKRIQIARVPDLDYAKLIVMAQLSEKSQSQLGQEAIEAYVKTIWDENENRLKAEATRRGCSPEEAFNQVLAEAMRKNS